MGTVLDTTVFIGFERAIRGLPAARAMTEVAQRLESQLGENEEVGIAAITASELLHGVHRASDEHRGRRAAFVEAVLVAFPTLSFDLLVARAHARLWAGLAGPGLRSVLMTDLSLPLRWPSDGESVPPTSVTSIGSPGWT